MNGLLTTESSQGSRLVAFGTRERTRWLACGRPQRLAHASDGGDRGRVRDRWGHHVGESADIMWSLARSCWRPIVA